MKTIKHWLILSYLLFTLTGCSMANCSDDPACLRVLFIGNSYTSVNDLPKTLLKLAQAGGQRLETGMAAPGGWTLAQHLRSSATLEQIKASKWNYVVLQEQSQVPANEAARNAQMVPAARGLAAKINAAGAKPILFVTWGHQSGWPDNSMPTYEGMQLALNYGYLMLGQELHASLAPVGYAWLALWRQNPKLNLWQEDGSHPNELGTYLAACVFYTVIFQKSPAGLSYRGNLSSQDAELLQRIAAETVLNNKNKWNLP
ncbi:MAG: hypothetical protein NTW32_01090 [Chloroflexi bacterium]|nr:hypothetical protein [Chloroflexota bacterium]